MMTSRKILHLKKIKIEKDKKRIDSNVKEYTDLLSCKTNGDDDIYMMHVVS